eukprot:gnl/TRDRNA2_/TRDRNA2_161206_c4_seq3.p1 gnl/TRDRNA2_/TRDRNA2_161206_c4~~gnl/TRDRNA2_/TRDRNA2_161206_c4_seq3.p1  ORF type:complete len:115 (+),score=6.82 gnl/TRDRNA2_/TRDRNA2_161206_c4_seq3:385-729(+)
MFSSAADETRCPHCFITFSTPKELLHHAAHHCFPHDHEEVMHRFPVGARVLDSVSGLVGTVVGPAENPKRRHAFVCVESMSASTGDRAIKSDIAISRLELIDSEEKRKPRKGLD